MEKRLDNIDDKLDKIMDSMNSMALDHSNRITRLETNQKGIVTLASALLTAIIGVVVKIFSGSH